MPFFRKAPDLASATLRPATANDLPSVSRLLRDSPHRYLNTSSGEIPALLNGAPSVVLLGGREWLGCALAGWQVKGTSWIRALALAEGIATQAGLDMLLPALATQARAQSVARFFYAGDSAADSWIQPALLASGWKHQTDVVVYEKTSFEIPGRGNQEVRVRRAQMVDLAAILQTDQHSFDAQWVKDESAIAPALISAPFFMVAESAGQVVGYAFVTSHFGGRLIHLVRIAVDPSFQGQGIGVRLLAEVVQFAHRCGATTLALNTQQENHTAQRLYEWFGFRRNGESQRVLSWLL